MSKILIAIGHGKADGGGYDSGATSNGYQEFKLGREVGKFAQEYYNSYYNEKCDLMNYNGNLSLRERINKLQDNTYDFVAEIHLNAGHGTGTECYYYHGSENCKKYAVAITDEISKEFGIRNRGPKTKLTSRGEDFFGIIRETKPTSVLVETMFIDSDDLNLIKDEAGQKKCGEAIAKAIAAVRGVSEKSPDPEPTDKGSYPTPVAWKNGSSDEIVYKQNDFKHKIGTLFPNDKAECISKAGDSYVVMYDIDNGHKKVGFVKYAGGVKYAPPESKFWVNGSTSETVYSDTAKQKKVGSIDPYEKVYCLGKINGMYIVLYYVTGTNTQKVGFVDYAGGIE